jgi:hypothetical protein
MAGGGLGQKADKRRAGGDLFKNPLAPVLAMGDGNHSAASARAAYEKLKAEIGAEAAAKHPRRWLCAS